MILAGDRGRHWAGAGGAEGWHEVLETLLQGRFAGGSAHRVSVVRSTGKGLPGWDAVAKLPGDKGQHRVVDVLFQRRSSSGCIGRWRKRLICP